MMPTFDFFPIGMKTKLRVDLPPEPLHMLLSFVCVSEKARKQLGLIHGCFVFVPLPKRRRGEILGEEKMSFLNEVKLKTLEFKLCLERLHVQH